NRETKSRPHVKHSDRKRKGDHQRSDSRPRRVPVECDVAVPKTVVGVPTRNRHREKSRRQVWAKKTKVSVTEAVEVPISIAPISVTPPVPQIELVLGLQAVKMTESLATMEVSPQEPIASMNIGVRAVEKPIDVTSVNADFHKALLSDTEELE
ncbi:hypothetical protein SOVF_028990, partial [Spinacia oleracea]